MPTRTIAITAAILIALPALAQDNLCPNPGFEQLDEAGWAEGWEIWPTAMPGGASVAIDTHVGHSGANALRLVHTAGSSYTRAQRPITVEPNTEYIFSCWIRCEDVEPVDGSQGARLYVEKATGDHAARRMIGNTPWTEVRLGPMNVGNVSRVTLMCYLHRCSGTVWFDDVSVVKVTDEVRASLQAERTRERLAADINSAWDVAQQAQDMQAMEALNALTARAATEELPTELDYRAGPPYFLLQAEAFAVAAAINRRAHLSPPPPLSVPARGENDTQVAAWMTDAFDAFGPVALVPEEPELSRELMLCTTDREQALLRLCNIGEEPAEVTVQVGRFEGEGAPAVTAREVVCVDPGGNDRLKGDPLPLLDLDGNRARLTLTPGLVRGVWLQIDADGTAPGLYELALTVSADGQAPIEAQVRARVLPVTMPERRPIVTWNYSYQHDWIMPERWEQARRDLVEHHINAYCWPSKYLPWPELDEAGVMKPLDWSAFDEGLRTHDGIDWLLLWPGFEWEGNLKLRNELEPGSEPWRELFVEWFTALREGLEARGYGADRVAWYLADEPVTEARARPVVLAGKVISEIAPDALVLANPYPAATWDVLRKMDPVVNLWCPSLSIADEEHLEFFRAGSEVLWSYQVLSKRADAFGSYRLSFWRLWDEAITGQGFWAYASAKGSAWNPWDENGTDYAPVYDGDPRELIPSIRWEAWREGVEDYTLLWMLDRALEEGRCADVPRAARALEDAREVLAAGTPEAVEGARQRVLLELAREG